jgi:Ca2+-binding RTX toxin-like protein
MALIHGTRLADTLNGNLGENDMLVGLGGNDTLNGGTGTDTAWYAGVLAGYRFASVNGRLTVQDINAANGQDGTDSLATIEKLQFSNAQLQLSTVPTEFRVNSTTRGNQNAPTITGLTDGGYVASWVFEHADGSRGIYLQRYDAQGLAVNGEIRASTNVFTTGLNPLDPSITGLDGGGFVVVWTEINTLTMGYDIFAQRYAADGAAAGAQFVVNSSPSNEQPAVAALANGGFVVSWIGVNALAMGYDIFARSFNAQGVATGEESVVNTITDGFQNAPMIAALVGGGFVVSWTSPNPIPMMGDLIYARHYDTAGLPVGIEFLVGDSSVAGQTAAPITALADGGFVVIWAEPSGPAYVDIYARRYDAAGLPVGAEFLINDPSTVSVSNGFAFNTELTLTIAGLADGGFVVGWSQLDYGINDTGLTTDINVHAQRFDAQDNAVGSVLLVNATARPLGSGAPTPTIAALDDGGFVVSWMSSQDQDGSGQGIYSQRYDAQGTAVGVQKLTGTASADVINLGDGQTLLVDGAGGNDSLNGAGADDHLVGGANNDTLNGGAGNDILDGGTGDDKLTGGAGDDLYVIDSLKDVITELAGAGNDDVRSSVTHVLLPTLENLELTGTGNINATGNANGNLLVGNSGNNVINGKAGADVMAGGAGNDTYHVDNLFDFISENAAQGSDLVQSSVSFTLGNNLENLTLTGTSRIDGFGNGEDNNLVGNAAANTLAGEDGSDNLNGGAGNDVLYGGTGNDFLTGGAGNDFLNGGANADTFVFNTALSSSTNLDHINDFSATDDVIHLSKSVFTALGTTGVALADSEFRAGFGFTTAADLDDHIIYNTLTGDLYYDRDGNSAAFAPVRFAVLDGGPPFGTPPSISADDLFVVS